MNPEGKHPIPCFCRNIVSVSAWHTRFFLLRIPRGNGAHLLSKLQELPIFTVSPAGAAG